jgi:hypothetical protein
MSGPQDAWSYCDKCHQMFYNGFPEKGVCAGGGSHEAQGYDFYLPHDYYGTPTSQTEWRFCEKCNTMFFDGFQEKGSCAAGGAHIAAGYNFVLPHDIPATLTAQDSWRYCVKCNAMFYDGYPQKGSCPAGGGHNAAGYDFVLPHDLPGTLDWDIPSIVFNNGVPVGGWSHLTLRADGTYTFKGSFHDSGAIGYDTAIVIAVKDSQDYVYTFQHKGHVCGTFDFCSRDDSWTVDGNNDQIVTRWANIAGGWSWEWQSQMDANIAGLTSNTIGALGVIVGIIGIVAA